MSPVLVSDVKNRAVPHLIRFILCSTYENKSIYVRYYSLFSIVHGALQALVRYIIRHYRKYIYVSAICIYDFMSLSNCRLGDYLHLIYPNELETKDTTNTQKYNSYLDLYFEIDNGGILKKNHITKTTIVQLSASQSVVV